MRCFSNAATFVERHKALHFPKFHLNRVTREIRPGTGFTNREHTFQSFQLPNQPPATILRVDVMKSHAQLRVNEPLNAEEIAALRRISSPTISNAIETFDVRPRGEGVSDPRIRCLFPEFGAMVGYACTAKIRSSEPASSHRSVSRTEYWEYTQKSEGPRITVVQDLSDEPGGAYWGEVNSSLHIALGSTGVITNGTVRDLAEVREIGFHMFASGVSVSHGFAHLEDFAQPVTVFGMTICPGDLVHADRHGAVVIPHEVARSIAATALTIERSERVIIDLCKSPSFSVDKLDKLISPEY
jgi:4-hydroxy-4-methyl-2-oxoglutarate aldolase